MELNGALKYNNQTIQVLILDPQYLNGLEILDYMANAVREVSALSTLTGNVGPTRIPLLHILLVHGSDVRVLLPATPLISSTWPMICSALTQVRNYIIEKTRNFVSAHYQNGNNLSNALTEAIQKSLEIKFESTNDVDISLVSARSSAVIMESSGKWPSHLAAFRVFRESGFIIQNQDVAENGQFLEEVLVDDSSDITGVLRRCLINKSSEKEDLQLQLDGENVTISCDLRERTISLTYPIKPLIPDVQETAIPSLKAVSVIPAVGFCESLLIGPAYIVTPTSSSQMDFGMLENNVQRFSTLQHYLRSNEKVMMARGKCEMYVLRPGFQGLLTVQQVATKETLLPIPVSDIETHTFDEQVVQETLKRIPHMTIYNPLDYDMDIIEQIESKIKCLKGFCQGGNKAKSNISDNTSHINRWSNCIPRKFCQ